MEESILPLNNLGDDYAEQNQPKLAALYFEKAQAAERQIVFQPQAIDYH
ncbi:hypothetical protein MTX78_14495 [Hymenobacter tibetensis]|uniref:Uncharacterized protein n=1 Tax=Hymenobacter tibetensis TaxID=497967 RepID=A0ABY4CT15_9BACT|nr:hypothetical protein [Hymenobacter tibetensis]UOG73333.1 hypothetical protein MTX78_14495 [Hymenobacter tibetensis]